MDQAAVALIYDIVVIPIDSDKHDDEERRVNCVHVAKIFDGKLAQSDVVADTAALHLEDSIKVACAIM
ncbi:hypothetical protein RQP46_005254 [Phenoliferia psychrophenolica]